MINILQITYNDYIFELGIYWGMLLGFRTFEADENYNQKELQIFIPFIYIAIVKKLQDD